MTRAELVESVQTAHEKDPSITYQELAVKFNLTKDVIGRMIRSKPPRSTTCPECGIEFRTVRLKQVFCSRKCQNRNHVQTR